MSPGQTPQNTKYTMWAAKTQFTQGGGCYKGITTITTATEKKSYNKPAIRKSLTIVEYIKVSVQCPRSSV